MIVVQWFLQERLHVIISAIHIQEFFQRCLLFTYSTARANLFAWENLFSLVIGMDSRECFLVGSVVVSVILVTPEITFTVHLNATPSDRAKLLAHNSLKDKTLVFNNIWYKKCYQYICCNLCHNHMLEIFCVRYNYCQRSTILYKV